MSKTMQTPAIAVLKMSTFGEGLQPFWMGELEGLLEQYPALEFPHKQKFYTLMIVENADGEITIDNHKIRIDQAKSIIIKPSCVSSIHINRQAKGKIICFSEDFFSLRYNNNILYQFSFLKQGAQPYIRLSAEQKEKWNILLGLLMKEYALKKRETQKVLRSYLNIVLYELERLYNPAGFVKQKSIKQEKVQEFEILIDKHFESKKLPSVYADLLHISPNYLNKICKEETGQTAGDIIRKRITIEAQRLLHYTNYSVCEIADKLGFESASYFVTFFRKQTDLTPELFRKNQC